MKRKRQESIINLAFNEFKNETEKKVHEASPLDNEGQKEYEFMSSLREGLKQAGQATPDCQMSVERIRDAILNQNIRESKNTTSFWSWASVGVAACAFLFVLNNNRNLPTQTRIVANTTRPSIIEENNPLVNRPKDNSVATQFEPEEREDAPLATETAASKPVRSRVFATNNRVWADINTTVANRAAETISTLASRSDAQRNTHGGPALPSVGHGDKKHEMVPPAPEPEPIILINTDTDNDTGAQVATEVDSVENVHIGG